MPEKIVITGGAGFIGTHLAERFVGKYRLVLLDNLRRDSFRHTPGLVEHPNVQLEHVDIRDPVAVAEAIKGAAAVLHLAAIAGVSSYYKEPVETLRVNILGTFNVLDAMLQTGAKRLIYFSTSEIYGPDAENANEVTSLMVSGPVSDRRWVYSVSKLAGEHAVLRHGEMHDLACSCIRPFNVYGPRQTGEGAISNFSRRVLDGAPLQVYGSGEEVRAWCYVSDLVDAVEAMLQDERAYGKSFNIGNAEARCNTNELAQTIVDLNGSGTIEHLPSGHTPIPIRYPNIDLAREVLGYEPKVSLQKGLGKTLNWFKEMNS